VGEGPERLPGRERESVGVGGVVDGEDHGSWESQVSKMAWWEGLGDSDLRRGGGGGLSLWALGERLWSQF
jgi:hypothetical protein